MGFDWSASVVVGYVQEVEFQNCYSRFATRCLKLANPAPSSAKRQKKAKPSKRKAGQPLTDEQLDKEQCAFSDTEEEVASMNVEDRKCHDEIKEVMNGNHANDWECSGLLNYRNGHALLKHAFEAAVDHLMPGQGEDFGFEVHERGGSYGEADDGAKHELAYIVYRPTRTVAEGFMDLGRGGINLPWGNKKTALSTLDVETSKQVDAAFAVIVNALGLKPVGAPGMSLITASDGG